MIIDLSPLPNKTRFVKAIRVNDPNAFTAEYRAVQATRSLRPKWKTLGGGKRGGSLFGLERVGPKKSQLDNPKRCPMHWHGPGRDGVDADGTAIGEGAYLIEVIAPGVRLPRRAMLLR